jgi:hypothetical protein
MTRMIAWSFMRAISGHCPPQRAWVRTSASTPRRERARLQTSTPSVLRALCAAGAFEGVNSASARMISAASLEPFPPHPTDLWVEG